MAMSESVGEGGDVYFPLEEEFKGFATPGLLKEMK
jgi:hypothetical protein